MRQGNKHQKQLLLRRQIPVGFGCVDNAVTVQVAVLLVAIPSGGALVLSLIHISAKTLFNGDNLGLQTYSVVRVFDYITTVSYTHLKCYRLVIQRQRRNSGDLDLWEGEYTYRKAGKYLITLKMD